MLDVTGINIDRLPFDELEVISELFEFEGRAILLHLRDKRKVDLLAYWADFDNTASRWLYSTVSKEQLFSYLIGAKSLKEILSAPSSEYMFLVDSNLQTNDVTVKLINSYLLPNNYLPNDDSYHIDGLDDFYSQYLDEWNYLHKLREMSYIFKIDAPDKKHGNTVSTKDAANVLNGVTESIEGYVSVQAFNLYSTKYGDVKKINRNINKLKTRLSPRIAKTEDHSFEVWVAIDILTFHPEDDPIQSELRSNLIDGYKNDVLDIDFGSEEDAKIIAEKFKPDERKKIYEPLIKLFDSDKMVISISDSKRAIVKKQQKIKAKQSFKNILFPPPTVQEVQEEIARKNKLFTVVFSLKEGEEIKTIDKKHLLDNLLFSQEVVETPFELPSPIEIKNARIDIKKPLAFILKVDAEGRFQLHNQILDLFAEGTDIHEVSKEIKSQFFSLVQAYEGNPETFDPIKKEELQKYI